MSTRRLTKYVEMSRGESLRITIPAGDAQVALDSQEITVTLEHKSGQHARLRIQAGDCIQIAEPAAAERRTG